MLERMLEPSVALWRREDEVTDQRELVRRGDLGRESGCLNLYNDMALFARHKLTIRNQRNEARKGSK